MSKFIEKLGKITRGEVASIGFRRAAGENVKKRMQLIACVSEMDTAVEADAVLIPAAGSPVKAASDETIRGVWLKKAGEEISKDSGYDFVVFPVDASLTLVSDKEVGKILEIDSSLNDYLVRTLFELPVDAVLVTVTGDNVTYKDLMTVSRFGGIPGKHLLVKLSCKVSAAELETLWQAGVIGIVAESNIAEIKKEIEAADFKSKSKRDKDSPVLGRISATQVDSSEEEDF
ncbi:MAG: hypothetical protein JW712_14465 [Dehalococcoidales bacterium]|nr:hypothetical protein [Dehalococcoidales bacterium]